ncbi:TlpA disulfide reductase family protein [Sorangium sp. So ce295]|uniref:TlpA family protein disulfide reductase n=1 Tax=Sorangium sp. So ce295 TaxID=3133295 RepID=UPI003F639572
MTSGARQWLRGLGVLGALGLVQGGAVLTYRAVEEARSQRVDAPFDTEPLPAAEAPDVEVEKADGSRVRLYDLRGRTVLLHFWATWCGPCEAELPGLLAFAREHQTEGVILLAVAVDESWHVVQSFFEGTVPPDIVRGVQGDEHKRYGVRTLPDTYFVQPSGKLAFHAAGAREWRSAAARAVLAEAQRGTP